MKIISLNKEEEFMESEDITNTAELKRAVLISSSAYELQMTLLNRIRLSSTNHFNSCK